MKSIDRMNCLTKGGEADRTPFVPSIYEHGAALLNEAPRLVSRDSRLMAQAALVSYATYKHDLVTVGIDIYNIEAEALGCQISNGAGRSIPGVVSHPLAYDEKLDPRRVSMPQPNFKNRLGLIAEAVRTVVDEIGKEVWVYGCMSGPFSQAVELRTYEKLIIDIFETPEAVHKLMEKTTELSLQQAKRLSQQYCGIYLYESWAALPLIQPGIFKNFVIPYNKRIISFIRREFKTPPPSLIMGGDTATLVNFMLEANVSLIAADFNTNFDLIRRKTAQANTIVRGCVDPKMIERGDRKGLKHAINTLATQSRGMTNFVWGCGCVSYDTTKENLLQFKDLCLQVDNLRRS